MRGTMSVVLALLLLGAVVLPGSVGKTRPPLWSTALAAEAIAEETFAVLSVPTGPVGAAAVAPNDALTIYLGGAEGLYRSTDGGEIWDRLSQELRYPHVLLVDPADPARLYAARRDLASFLPLPGVYLSEDGGYTWKRLLNGLGENRVFSLALDPFHAGTLYAGSWAGRIYRTSDGGDRWQPIASGALRPCPTCSPSTVSQLLIDPRDGALYAVETYGGAFRSTDGGTNWVQISGDSGWLAVDAERGDLYLAGRRLQRSTDGGRTWVDLSAGLPFSAATGAYVTFWMGVNPNPLILYTRYHCSTDGGTTWESLGMPTSFVPRLLLPAAHPAILGSVNGQAGRYQKGALDVP